MTNDKDNENGADYGNIFSNSKSLMMMVSGDDYEDQTGIMMMIMMRMIMMMMIMTMKARLK